MMYAAFATTKETLKEIQSQIGLNLDYKIISNKLLTVSGESYQVMMLIGRYADNGDDCLIKAEAI